MGWFNRCRLECAYCTGGNPSAPTVTLANYPQPAQPDNCNCADLNATHTTALVNPAYPCGAWQVGGYLTAPSAPQCNSYLITAELVTLANGNYGWRVTVYVGGWKNTEYEWDSGAATAFDCTAQRTLTETFAHATVCVSSTNTCQIN